MNPEKLEGELSEQSAEQRLGEQGYVEVPADMTEQVIKDTKEVLYELPNELRTAFDRVAPGLGGEAFARAQEVSGKLLRQLEDAGERGGATEYGSFNDNTAVSNDQEALNFGDINRIVSALKLLAEQLDDQARRQPGDVKIIDLDRLDGGEPRAVPEFWYVFTGNAEYGSGHETQVGAYSLSAEQSQDAKGPGSESRKLIIRKTGAPQEEAGSVVAAEESDQELAPESSSEVVRDFNRYEPKRRFEQNAGDNPAEQTRAAS